MPNLPVIPETFRVHLGPPDSNAPNVTVSFPDYIKNVASSEIYPTWPESALRANILAQISFALNRIYTEYYPSLGYDFDITNSTGIDQSFVNGRDIFENISRLVDEIFNRYIVRNGNVEPLFAVYCNGTTTTCNGLSQWGSVSLAEQGLGAFDILTRYYGNDISLVDNAPIEEIAPSEPEILLRRGSAGNDVAFIQMRLNRISANYPAIPKINPVNGFFGEDTENAVLTFQRVFDLIPDGIVGKATWYKIQFVYNAVKKLNELESEGLRLEDVSKQFPGVLSLGDTGENVRIIQYFLSAVSFFNSAVPDPGTSGVYDEATRNAVIAFQAFSGLPQTGVTDDATWNLLYDDYLGDIRSLTSEQIGSAVIPFPGVFLQLGDTGENITVLQNLIDTAADVYNTIPPSPVTGVFDENTRDAVFAAETLFGLPVDGIVGPLLWDTLADIESDIRSGEYRNPGQFSGNPLSAS